MPWRIASLLIVPALVVIAVYEGFLGHRHDYTGHFAAGFGATLAALMFWLRSLPQNQFIRYGLAVIVPACLFCIGLGTITEATIFRLAKFDEVDFCNQSVGAVLAALCSISMVGDVKPATSQLDVGLVIGIAFLGAGGCFAVA